MREEKWAPVEESAAGSMSAMQTVAPRDERILDAERPIPEAPPVRAMILPCIDIVATFWVMGLGIGVAAIMDLGGGRV